MLKLGIYQHYKQKLYQVVAVALHSETLKSMVVYRALYDDHQLWVRPLEMFLESVEVDGQQTPRFKFVSQQNTEDFLNQL